ncbi:MAG: peptidoglycan-binding protein [Candidatus Sericytochromatia bacterium]
MAIELARILRIAKPTHVPACPEGGAPPQAPAGKTPILDVFLGGIGPEEPLPESDRPEVYGGPAGPEWANWSPGSPVTDEPVGGAAPVLRRGSRGAQVRSLQEKLKAAGHNPGGVDGVFGPNTEAAVRRFQQAKGLTVDGIAGPQTMGALSAGRPSGAPGVQTLQRELKQAGFNPGGIDGKFGPNTQKAVERFQRAKGLAVDGVVGPKTWAALGVKSNRILRRQAPASHAHGSVNTPDGPMVRRDGGMISARIAGQYDRMVAAARRDGVTLRINSGYRSYAEQVVLWNRYGRNPARVARPGHSNHQSGTAVDFSNIGGAWAWLKRNASRYGFHNYPPEPWHYSLNGR